MKPIIAQDFALSACRAPYGARGLKLLIQKKKNTTKKAAPRTGRVG